MKNKDEEIIVKLLCELLPDVIELAEKTINVLHNPSKLFLESNDKTGVFTGKNLGFYKLYLTPDKYYKEFKAQIIQDIFEESITNPPTPPLPIKTAKVNFYKAINDLEQEIYEKLSIDEPLDMFDKIFLDRAIIHFYNALSLIQNKKSISDLLYEAIHYKNYKLIPLAVNIDPNILKIPEITGLINSIPKSQRLDLEQKIIEVQRNPILSYSKSPKSKMALFYLGLVDFIGFLDGPYAISFRSHQIIADTIGVLKDFDDINYFNKLYNQVKKSKHLH